MKSSHQINWKKLFFTILRMAVGWHFLYEGVSKLVISNWSSYSYLANSSGPFSGLYHSIAASPHLLKVIDLLNIYGLILIGLGLFIGIFARLSAVAGALLLTLYYFAYPPFGASLFNTGEGHLFIVDKLFIETAVLLFLAFYKEHGFGIDYLIDLIRIKTGKKVPGDNIDVTYSGSRREALKNLATLPVLGIMGFLAAQNNRKYGIDVMSGATIQLKQSAIGELKGTLPTGKIGDHVLSRMVLGGNLIGGWAHSRDLIYVPELFKAYNSERKIYETLILAEKAGVNAINIGFPTNALIAKYKKTTGSKIKVISQVHPDMEKNDYFVNINKAIDFGVDIVQVQGNWCDWLVRDNKIEVIGKMLDRIRSQKYTAGLAAHSVESLIACENIGIIPDYYMKTMHHDKYWSAHPREFRHAFEVDGEEYLDHNRFHNNMFCLFPERTVEFVNKAKVPVMGYKVLAAGAIEPKDGFKWAFDNGADFICVGMFDFQIVKDVNICLEVLNGITDRKREWYG
ncbi:MAG: DoxX family membrane protein [Bacteroidales bacterium]|nr:DoxX family membrane protein [Bacteroidales bacterium]